MALERRSPIGREAKLNELILLSMIAALDELGRGFEQDILKKHADHATDLWRQHLAALGVEKAEKAIERFLCSKSGDGWSSRELAEAIINELDGKQPKERTQ